MEKYIPRENDFVGKFKEVLRTFVKNSSVLDDKVKKDFLEEIGTNWNDDRFSAEKLLDSAVGLSIDRWSKHNFELSEFWKQIALNSANVSQVPHEVADRTVKGFKNTFNVE